MGNRESNSMYSTPKRSETLRRTHSPSPCRMDSLNRNRSESLAYAHSARKLSSFRKDESDLPMPTINKNRSKSFRAVPHSHQARGRRKSDICETTGLSAQQKAILAATWRHLPRALVFDLGKKVFEAVFEKEPSLLSIIGLDGSAGNDEWRHHVNFRMHAQRFTHTLSQCIRNLTEPVIAADRLQEFGAAYAEIEDANTGATRGGRIPHSYWDRLSSALILTAKEFLEVDTPKAPRKKDSLSVGSATIINSGRLVLQGETANVCAWSTLAVFIANQIRFGYEMETMLRAEFRKLGLNHQRRLV